MVPTLLLSLKLPSEMSRLTDSQRNTVISPLATLEVRTRPSSLARNTSCGISRLWDTSKSSGTFVELRLTAHLTADIPSLRPMLQNYLACGSNTSEAADFFSLNVYEWCGGSSFGGSGYNELVQNATGLQIPIFISETGCRIPKPRTFDDMDSILGKDMEDVFSGAIVYEWIEETNDYGLISYGPKVNDMTDTDALDGYIRTGTPTPVSPDYSNLKKHWATLHPTGVALSAYSASASSLTPIACPSSTVDGWIVDPTQPLPSIGQTLDLAATSTGGLGGSATAKPSSTAKKGDAAAMHTGNEVAGMGAGLIGVMLGFLFWL